MRQNSYWNSFNEVAPCYYAASLRAALSLGEDKYYSKDAWIPKVKVDEDQNSVYLPWQKSQLVQRLSYFYFCMDCLWKGFRVQLFERTWIINLLSGHGALRTVPFQIRCWFVWSSVGSIKSTSSQYFITLSTLTFHESTPNNVKANKGMARITFFQFRYIVVPTH